MPWKRMLAYITGSVNEDLLRRIEYLLEENRVLRNQIDKRILLTDHERRTLATKAVALGKLMEDTVTIVKPETILKWHRRLVAKKFDGSRFRKQHGRPPIKAEIEDLVIRLARDNPARGYDRILNTASIAVVKLPPHFPNLNAFAERFVKTIKTECVEQFVLFDVNSLQHVIRDYLAHYHAER